MPATLRFSIEGEKPFLVQLDRFQENFRTAEPAFEAMADFQATIWKRQFDQEGAYTGTRWSALSPAYGRWKQRHYPGKPILQLSGDLYDSMASRPFGTEIISHDQMVIGTGVPYAAYHQHGTETMPARPIIQKPSAKDRLQFAKYLQNWIVKGTVT
jgi:phage gpG-like protein